MPTQVTSEYNEYPLPSSRQPYHLSQMPPPTGATRLDHWNGGPISNPSIAPTSQTVQTIRSTNQKIHSYTNAHRHHLQEKIPPNKPYIGLRPAYRPGYAICVLIAGGINLISGILMTALAYSRAVDEDNLTARVLRVLGPVAIVIGGIFLICGLVLLFHFRHRKRKERLARERGHGPIDRPTRRHRRPEVPREYQNRHGTQMPAESAADDYSYYDSMPKTHMRTGGRESGRLQRPPGGDWKYVSDIKDATLSPKYPREERKPLDAAAGYRFKMYPYDQSFRSPYSQTAAVPERSVPAAALPPLPTPRQPPRRETRRDYDDRRY